MAELAANGLRMREMPFGESRSVDPNLGLSSWLKDLWLPGTNTAKVTVTETTALGLSPVWRAVDLLTGAISTLPVGLTVDDRPVDVGWLDTPNRNQVWVEFCADIVASLALDGNTFIYVISDGGSVAELIVLDPGTVQVDKDGASKRYVIGGETIPNANIVHIPWLKKPGEVRGLDPMTVHREGLGAALAAQNHAGSFFGNGALPASVLQYTENARELSDTEIRLLRQQWNQLYQGSKNANKTAVLPAGLKLEAFQLDNERSQFLETRMFHVEELARIYGVPPHLLGHTEKSTSWGTGLSEQNRAFAQYTLKPWLERIEAHLSRLAKIENGPTASVRFDTRSYTRGSPAEQAEYVKGLVAAGLMTVDEARKELGFGPMPETQPVVEESTDEQ